MRGPRMGRPWYASMCSCAFVRAVNQQASCKTSDPQWTPWLHFASSASKLASGPWHPGRWGSLMVTSMDLLASFSLYLFFIFYLFTFSRFFFFFFLFVLYLFLISKSLFSYFFFLLIFHLSILYA